jgi:long-subunit fatty acid transport protein
MMINLFAPKRVAALLAAGTLLATTAPVAQADSLGYSYWQLGYVSADIDGLDSKLDGWGVGLSYEVTDRIFIDAGYTDVGGTESGLDLNEQDLTLGVGYAYPITPHNDLIGRVGYVRAEAEVRSVASTTDDGYSVGVGWRSRPLDPIELEAAVNYVDLSDAGDTTTFGLGAFWYFTPQVALAVAGSYNDDVTSFTIGVRGTWGRQATRD